VPIYMDMHPDLGDVTDEDLQAAHQRDLEVQEEYGVQFLTYWFNSPGSQAFCLVEAPDPESAVAVHKASHGLVPHKVVEVERPTVTQFMGDWMQNVPNEARIEGPGSEIDSGLRAILFTDLEGSTDVSTSLGDEHALLLINNHNSIVRDALRHSGGREVKHTGDGILASFSHVSRAVDCAMEVQKGFATNPALEDVRVRIGVSVGEPITQENDIFGAAVNLASRICAHAEGGQILVSNAVKDLCVGKPFRFANRGPIALKGFDEPVPLYEVDYSER